MRAHLGSTPFPVRGRSSSFYTFFQDCVRGQHLCLAHVERSSLHTKTMHGMGKEQLRWEKEKKVVPLVEQSQEILAWLGKLSYQ